MGKGSGGNWSLFIWLKSSKHMKSIQPVCFAHIKIYKKNKNLLISCFSFPFLKFAHFPGVTLCSVIRKGVLTCNPPLCHIAPCVHLSSAGTLKVFSEVSGFSEAPPRQKNLTTTHWQTMPKITFIPCVPPFPFSPIWTKNISDSVKWNNLYGQK